MHKASQIVSLVAALLYLQKMHAADVSPNTGTTTGTSTNAPTLSMYNTFFTNIRAAMEDSEDDKTILNNFEQQFYSVYSTQKSNIHSSSLDIDVQSEISTVVNAYKYDKENSTYAYGTEQNNEFVKILISGAKGTKTVTTATQLTTLALAEIVELNQTADAIAYAARISDTDYIIDAKVDDADDHPQINEKGQYLVAKSQGKRYIIDSLKSSLAVNKMYRLALGSDYVKFEINLLMAGASVKPDSVISKSTIKVMSYVITNTDYKVRSNIGLFTSDNKTNKDMSVSTHFGYLRVQQVGLANNQTSGGSSMSTDTGTSTSAYFLDFLNTIKK